MIDILLPLIPVAITTALSPVPIAELILVLISKRAKVNGVVFVTTVLLTAFLVPLAGAFVLENASGDKQSTASSARDWIFLVLGVLLLAVAFRLFRQRRDASAPKVFDAIAGMGPGAVFVLAIGVGLFNPKNLAMLITAGARAGSSGGSNTEIVLALVLFAVIATSPYLAAVGYLLLGGDGAAVRLGQLKQWLIEHNKLIMAIVLGVIAVVLLAQAIPGLLG